MVRHPRARKGPGVGTAETARGTHVELRVLGPVDARDAGANLPLGGPRPRAVLAALALADGPVSPTRLIEEVWREQAPPTATGTLQSYLSRLRRVLGQQRLVRGPSGYEVRLDAEELDLHRFHRSLTEARAARDAGLRDDAVTAYDDALACWRGEVAEGLDPGPIIREAAARLNEEHLSAIEERVEVLLSSGRHHEVVGDLQGLASSHPHRERLHAQRLVALYRSGRQGDALAAYRQARDALVTSLGIEPGPQLRELHQRILDQDPRLGLHATTVPDVTVVDQSASGAGLGAIGNLPTPLGSFVGRVAARRDIAARLAGDVRLLTLVGAGGCGKTQLALRSAAGAVDGYPQGTWWVELAAHRDADRVVRATADALGIAISPTADPLGPVAARLSAGRALLVLDNCEHLVDACADLAAELLRRCPQLRILATSREPLDVEGEQIWRVPSLSLPELGASLASVHDSEAAQLLLLRGRAVRPELTFETADAPTVSRICRELDGIPLALELAAARLNVLSLEELAERLEDRLAVLAHGRRSAPARHRTLEAAIAWSYDLLSVQERRLLTHLTVFSGGSTVGDAEVVCAETGEGRTPVVDLLGALVDKSLVQRTTDPDGRARLDLLATVRSFAESRIEPDDAGRLRDRHADHYAELAELAAPELTGADQVAWLNRLHAEQGNLRVVLERGDAWSARLAASVWWFWLQFGHAVEGDRWLRGSIGGSSELSTGKELELHRGAARLAAAVDAPVRARDYLDVAIAVGQRMEAWPGVAQDHALRARFHAEDGAAAAVEALALARKIADRADDAWTIATVEQHAATVAWYAEEFDAAAVAAEAAEAGFRAAGDRWSACLARLDAARIARRRGRRTEAARLHRTNLERGLDLTVSSLDFVGLPQDLQDLASLALESGEVELAATLLGTIATLRTAVELPGSTAARLDDLVERARACLDASAFERAYELGRVHPAEGSVALALELTCSLASETTAR